MIREIPWVLYFQILAGITFAVMLTQALVSNILKTRVSTNLTKLEVGLKIEREHLEQIKPRNRAMFENKE